MTDPLYGKLFRQGNPLMGVMNEPSLKKMTESAYPSENKTNFYYCIIYKLLFLYYNCTLYFPGEICNVTLMHLQ